MFEHIFEAETLIDAPLAEVFSFFSDAGNLARLTPATLDFKIHTPMPLEMREGALIDYTIRLHGIPMKWRTIIRRWAPGREFVDEQLRGPYRKWVHHHRFEAVGENRTRMRDRVEYAIPFPPFGEIALPWVRSEIRGIFEFRERTIREIFKAIDAASSDQQP